jgi:Rod binding domain-containing protein
MNNYNKFNNNVTLQNKPIDTKLKKATDGFEAIYVRKMLENAFKDSSIGGTGPGKDIIKSMYLDAISNSGNGSMGISKMLYDNLIKGQNK